MSDVKFRGKFSDKPLEKWLEKYELTWLDGRDDEEPPTGSPIVIAGYRRGMAPPNKGRKYPASPPTTDEVMRMLALCGNGYVGRRNHALIVTMWRAGLRVSEALALRPYHIEFGPETQITVMSGKGGKRRTVGIDPWGADQIQAWSKKRQALGIKVQDAPLFCTISRPSPGGPLNTAYVREMVRELARRAEVPRRVAPHQYRHACAVFMARNGVPMHLIQRQLGHSNLGTTATYLQGIAPFEVIAAMQSLPAPVEDES